MIRSNHQRFYVSFFRHYSNLMITKDFRSVNIISDVTDNNGPILLIGNHFSWWDGFFVYYLNYRFFRRKIYIMMLEEQLRKRMFLNKAGAFSVKKGSRSVVESLDYAANVLGDAENLLAMYPQGEIQSRYTRPLVFEKGVGEICKRADAGFQVVFYAALVDYFSNRKPSLYFHLTSYDPAAGSSDRQLQDAYNQFFENSVKFQRET